MIHASIGKHLRLLAHRSVVRDAEEGVQVGVGVFWIRFGCESVRIPHHVYSPIYATGANVPPDFGCSAGCVLAHSCFACLINDSLCSHSFFEALALSCAVNESWWYAP